MQIKQAKKAAPAMKEQVPKIRNDAAIGVMKHKDGTTEKRKF